MTLRERISKALADFRAAGWRDDWDTTIVDQEIRPASRTPGLAVYTTIRDGVTFETPIEAGDNVAAMLGASVH